ncbi:Uncharacterized protein HZ326_31834 [Fusarium oxysporum f. sp. albedinis]|nr:Uncharacterized protein HZ326_31834 [Fusarium oxysporum f. sp. albedinis]
MLFHQGKKISRPHRLSSLSRYSLMVFVTWDFGPKFSVILSHKNGGRARGHKKTEDLDLRSFLAPRGRDTTLHAEGMTHMAQGQGVRESSIVLDR